MPDARIFFGGLGQITGGMSFTPDFHGVLNRHPFPDVVHGCLLEGMALALERRFEPFSQGRGFITPQRVEEIETIAARHGIHLAPLYNADGPVEYDTRTDASPWTGATGRPGTSPHPVPIEFRYETLLRAQGLHRIDRGGPLRRDNAGEERADRKRHDRSSKDQRVPAPHLVKLSGN